MRSRIKGTLFFNSSSGSGFSDADRIELKASSEEAGLRFVRITPDISVAAIVREGLARGQMLFVAAGGDGTLNHVAQAVIRSEASFAVVPIGTYNHFARDLGVPLDWRDAFEVALTGETILVDAARINDRYFLNNISLGIYPDAVRRREEKGRHYPRWRAIPYAAFMAIKKFQPLSIAIETAESFESAETQLFMVSNNAYELARVGLEARRISLRGGHLAVYWVPEIPRVQFILLVARYIRGKVEDFPGLRTVETMQVKVRTPHTRARVAIDGEVVSMRSPLVITSVPRALRVKVPPGSPAAGTVENDGR